MIKLNNPEYAEQMVNAEPLNAQDVNNVASIINTILEVSQREGGLDIGKDEISLIQIFFYEYEKLKNPWVSVEKALPEFSGFYIVSYTNSNKHVTRAYFEENNWYHSSENNWYHAHTKRIFNTVNFWMPLPNPPKKD